MGLKTIPSITSTVRSKILGYVINRQNADGGYTFCLGAESNAQDTYYALVIMKALNQTFPNANRTATFIRETRFDGIYSLYYATEAQQMIEGRIDNDMKRKIISMLKGYPYFGSDKILFEASSEFTTTFMALELSGLIKMKNEAEEVERWLLSFKNTDGGFGVQGHSDISATYYVIASLVSLSGGFMPAETLGFVRACEKTHGGFTLIPINYTPYIEYTFYGVMTLDMLGEKCRYPQQTANWVLSCQNENGGFARGDLGISSMINTYQAVACLEKLSSQEEDDHLSMRE